MRIADNQALDPIRDLPRCEWCKEPARGRLQAAHIFARGWGNAKQVDRPWNACGLCFKCHHLNENGHRPNRNDLLRVAGKREGLSPARIEAWIYKVRLLPKGSKEPPIRTKQHAKQREGPPSPRHPLD